MDFPVCPACRQSVLDDDAEDCPFCGASMKAKPGAKPAAVAAKPAAATAKPVGVKAGPGKPTLPGDDFPFEAELTSGKSAIQAMPNPTKQRTLQIICPMCDTPGYVAPTAAGQDVRCANAKCVMPVFTAPSPKKKEEAPPPPPPKSNNLLFVGGVTVVLGLAILGGVFYLNSLPQGPKVVVSKGMSDEDKELLAEMTGKGKKAVPVKPVKSEEKELNGDPAAPNAVAEISANDLIKSALKQMKESCLEKKQRSKPFSRQMTAEANAITGNVAAAHEDLAQLLKAGSDFSYYQIAPLLELFWADLSAGNKKEAAKSLALATAEVPKIPKFGRTRLEIAGRLAAALVAAGQSQDASKLLEDFHAADSDAQLAARLQIATDGKVAPLTNSFSVLPWKFPQSVAATASLIARGQNESAAAWAAGQANEDAKAECVAFWAEDLTHRKAAEGETDVKGAIVAAVKTLPPALEARVWARAGCGRSLVKDQAGANAAIKLAREKLAQISVPEQPTMPDFKLTDRFKRPTAAPLLQAATAAAEIAFLQAQSADTKTGAESSLDLALSFMDATAPSLAAAQERHAEADQLGPTRLRERLKAELKINDAVARQAANKFNNSLDDIMKASQQRFDIEKQIMSRLRGAGVGLNTKVWIIVNSRTTADDINKRDNFLATSLAGELVQGLQGTPEEQAIIGAWNAEGKKGPIPRPVAVEFNELLKTNVAAAVEFIQKSEASSSQREEILLRAASRLPAMDKLQIAFQFISKLDDKEIVVREDCYLLAAALGAQRGQAGAVWKQVAHVNQHTEKIAICRGLIAGLKAAGTQPEQVLDMASLP